MIELNRGSDLSMPLDPNRRRTVWVVDDSPTDAERVRRLLAADHEVSVMYDGGAALEQVAAGSLPDLMVLDWVMPGVSGIEVCKFMRASAGPLQHVPILLLTSRHETQEILQAFKSGANDYVSKPFVNEELQARVTALLRAKQLLERAEQAEADARTLLATAPDPMFVVNAQGSVIYVNDEGLRTLRCSNADALGKPLSALVDGIRLCDVSVAPDEAPLPIPEVYLGNRIFSPSIRVLPSARANTTTVALRDVTAHKDAEARRLDFYSIIAHDLRSPLSVVMMRIDRALRGKHGMLPASLIADLRKVEANLRSLVGMINDFLELARFEGLGSRIDCAPVDMSELVRATMDDFRPLFESQELAWVPIGTEAEAMVSGDRDRLAQVFGNLVGNAIKFTPPGGKITTMLTVSTDSVEASNADTGPGIAQEELPHVFDRFSRARATTSRAPGTGLGLMIVREIVQAHGGVVGVESRLGQGSKFWFRLPRSPAPHGAQASSRTTADR
jgi:two-component system phosphate regulon sensor histidine kinase PhoR